MRKKASQQIILHETETHTLDETWSNDGEEEQGNQVLLEQLKRQNREQEIIINFTHDLRQAQTVYEVQVILVEEALGIFDAEAAAFILNQNGVFQMGACSGKWVKEAEICLDGNEDIFHHVLASGQPLFIDSSDQKLKKMICPQPFNAPFLPRLISCVPVIIHTEEILLGLLILGHYSDHLSIKSQINLLLSIVEIASISIQRLKTKQTNEQLVARRTNELTALYNVISAAGQSKGLKDRLDTALGEVLQSLYCQQGAIFLYDKDKKHLVLIASRFTHKEEVSNISIEDSREGWVVVHEEVLIIPDMLVDKDIWGPTGQDNHQKQVYIGMPIKTRGKTTGVLSIFRTGKEIFDIEEITFISALANHIGVIIENNFLIEQVERTTLLEERARLARELHDSVTQTLYSAAFFAEAGLGMAEQGNLALVKENLTRLSQISQQALKEMRLLIYQLRPEILENKGLFPAILQRLELVENKVGIRARFTTNIISRLSKPLEDALYWISVEALNNVVKHARADVVELKIFVKENRIILSVFDNGIGFDLSHPRNSSGFGISNIRERVGKIGGSLDIKSIVGNGTILTVNCPLDEDTSGVLELDAQMKEDEHGTQQY
jgi:signal transduction histidine kinase